jgi:hypothetical protein
MRKKNDARVIVCFQAPPMDQRYLKGRRGIFVYEEKEFVECRYRGRRQ